MWVNKTLLSFQIKNSKEDECIKYDFDQYIVCFYSIYAADAVLGCVYPRRSTDEKVVRIAVNADDERIPKQNRIG